MYDGMGRKITPRMVEVQRVVARHNGITVEDIKSPCRKANWAWPRQIAAYLCREMTTCSLPEIGRLFGGRDHTTILFAWRKVRRLRNELPELDSMLCVYAAEIMEVAALRMEEENEVRIVPAELPPAMMQRMMRGKYGPRGHAPGRFARHDIQEANEALMGGGA